MGDMLKRALSMGESATRRLNHYMTSGALHNFGADPVHATAEGGMMFKFLNRNVATYPDKAFPTIGDAVEKMTTGQKVFAGLSLAGTGMSAAMGYGEAGILGAARNVTWDIGVDAAMVQHGYSRTKQAGGLIGLTRGRLNPRFLRNMGARGEMAASILGGSEFFGRMVVGSMASSAVGHALGGGIIGTAGALLGGSLGVKHAGKLAMAAGGYYLGKTVARGTYNVLKAGYSHFQAQKQIQTSGDMAAFFTQGAFNQRERAVQSIQRSANNARSALSREAQYIHSSRNYFSPYRQF